MTRHHNDGRPSYATVVVVVPSAIPGEPRDSAQASGFVFREGPADIGWSSGQPVLTFRDPPRL